MTATFVQQFHAQSLTTTVSVTLSGVTAGNYLIASVGTSGTPTVTAPSGWTLAETQADSAWAGVWYRKADASDAAGVTYQWTSSTAAAKGLTIVEYRGVSAIAAHAGVTAYGSAGSTAGPTVTATGPNQTTVMAATLYYGSSTMKYIPSGWTKLEESPGAYGSVWAKRWSGTGAGSTLGGESWGSSRAPSTDEFFALVTLLLSENTAPNAPTLTSPTNNATIDRGITQRFAWQFSDPDPGDSQSKFDLQYRAVGGSTWTGISGTTPNTYYDFSSGNLAAGNYEWQVRTYDSQGLQGPWSASSFFTAADAPATPTITAPTSGSTVSSTATVTWSTPTQTDYQVRRVADDGSGNPVATTVYYDSGDVASASTRSVDLTFDTNNRWEHIQVRIKNNGLWSAWADIRVQVSYTQAAPATVSKTPDDATGSILIHITNPAPGTGQPAASYNEVWIDDGNGLERKATMIPPNTDWRFWTPIALRDYDGNVVVKTVGDNGTVVESAA